MAKFDAQKAGFYLVACVVAWILLMVTAYGGLCLMRPDCTQDGRMYEFVNTILASVFAFVSGLMVSTVSKE